MAGLEAIEEGVGRATEMGKPVLFIPGTGDIDQVETLAGLAVLGRIAKITATYDTPLMVPCLYPMPLAAAGEVVKQSYIDAGKPDSYNDDIVQYMAGESFGFSAAVNGWMIDPSQPHAFTLVSFTPNRCCSQKRAMRLAPFR